MTTLKQWNVFDLIHRRRHRLCGHQKSRFFFAAVAYFLYAEPVWSRVSCLTCQLPYLKGPYLQKTLQDSLWNGSWTYVQEVLREIQSKTQYLRNSSLLMWVALTVPTPSFTTERTYTHISIWTGGALHTRSLVFNTALAGSLPAFFRFPQQMFPISSQSFVCLPAEVYKNSQAKWMNFYFPLIHINKKAQIWWMHAFPNLHILFSVRTGVWLCLLFMQRQSICLVHIGSGLQLTINLIIE